MTRYSRSFSKTPSPPPPPPLPSPSSTTKHTPLPTPLRRALRHLRQNPPTSSTADSVVLPYLSQIRRSLSHLPIDHPHSSIILATLLPLLTPQPPSLPVAHHTLAILAHHQLKPVHNLDVESPIIHTLHLYPFSAAFAHTAFSALQNLARPTNRGGRSKKVCQAVTSTMERHYTHAKLLLRGVDLLAYHLHSGLIVNGGNGKSGNSGDMPDKEMCLMAVLKAERKLITTREGVSAVLLAIAPAIAGGSLNRLNEQVGMAVVECMTTHIGKPSVQVLGAEAIAAALTPAAGYGSSLFTPEVKGDTVGGQGSGDGSSSGPFGRSRNKSEKGGKRGSGAGNRKDQHGSDHPSAVSDADPVTGSSPPSTASKMSVPSIFRSSSFHPPRLSSSTVSLSFSSRTMSSTARNSSPSYRRQAMILLRSECLEALTSALFAHQEDPSVVIAALRAVRCIATAAGVSGVRSLIQGEILRRTGDAVELAVRSGGGVGDEVVRKVAVEVRELLRSIVKKGGKAESRGMFRKGWMKMFGGNSSGGSTGTPTVNGLGSVGGDVGDIGPRDHHHHYGRASRARYRNSVDETVSLRTSKSTKPVRRKGGGWGFRRAWRAKKGSGTVSLAEPDWDTVDGVPSSPVAEDDVKVTAGANQGVTLGRARNTNATGQSYDSTGVGASSGWDNVEKKGPRTINSVASTVTHSRETSSATHSRSRNSLHL